MKPTPRSRALTWIGHRQKGRWAHMLASGWGDALFWIACRLVSVGSLKRGLIGRLSLWGIVAKARNNGMEDTLPEWWSNVCTAYKRGFESVAPKVPTLCVYPQLPSCDLEDFCNLSLQFHPWKTLNSSTAFKPMPTSIVHSDGAHFAFPGFPISCWKVSSWDSRDSDSEPR